MLERSELEAGLRAFAAHDYPAVVAAVALITGDRPAAEDAVADAMVRLLSRPPAEPLRSVAAWITVVASNGERSRLRRRDAEDRAYRRLGDDGAAPDPAEIALAGDRAVLDAVAALPLRQRQICILHYYLDRPVADVAAALGVSEGTVKTQLHRARAALAERLGEPAPEETP